jgi:hypothetical protein
MDGGRGDCERVGRVRLPRLRPAPDHPAMRWFWFAFYRLLPVAIVVAVTLGMRAVMSPWLAWLATIGGGALLAVVGALVLRTTKVGDMTWKNTLAGHLLPWGYHLGVRQRQPRLELANDHHGARGSRWASCCEALGPKVAGQ